MPLDPGDLAPGISRVDVNLGWAFRRLTVMGGREIVFRIGRAGQARLEQLGFGLAKSPEPWGAVGHAWVDEIAQDFNAVNYIAAADRILAGQFDLFAMRPAVVGFPPRWNRDPHTEIEAPLRFGKTLNYRDETVVGDIKYLWEMNRHLELVTLAQAWHISRQARYSNACRDLLQSWFDQCPYPLGPNWTSSLEHGIRLVNWAVAWQLLQTSDLFARADRQSFVDRWRQSIYQHCYFIAGHLSRHSSANNHLLGELAGLLVGALTWPCWAESATWIDQAHREFETQCLLQTYPDGVNREQAIWYHHSVADMMLIVGLFARSNSRDFSARFWQRLELMLDFIASIMDVAGHVPAFGDADDAVLVRFSADRPANDYSSLLAAGGLLFDRPDLQAKAGSIDDKSRWLLGDAVMQCKLDQIGAPTQPTLRKTFPDGGYFVLGDYFDTNEEIRIVADAGLLGYLAIAAHGHADALSFTLAVAGFEFLVDSGTYAYHTQPRWREYFRGTSAHNTLRVDRGDQSIQWGSFLWGRRATVVDVEYQSDQAGDRLSAAHDGYACLPGGVRVGRTIEYDRARRVVTINDELSSRLPHYIEIFWHFSEACVVRLAAGAAVVRNGTRTLVLTWPTDMAAKLVRGQENPPLGWRSKSYDVRIPIDTLVVYGHVNGDWHGATTIASECTDGQLHEEGRR